MESGQDVPELGHLHENDQLFSSHRKNHFGQSGVRCILLLHSRKLYRQCFELSLEATDHQGSNFKTGVILQWCNCLACSMRPTLCTSFPGSPLCSPYTVYYYSPVAWWNKCKFLFPSIMTWVSSELVHQLNVRKGPLTASICGLSRSNEHRLNWKTYPEQL